MSSEKPEIIQPRLLKGFRDYLPPEMRARQGMINRIVSVFERFGFGPLGTPALEYTDIILGKYGADAEKLLYRFLDNGQRDVCLRYDLTVPLARVAAQYGELPKPFKRYQVAPVWRAEKPGRGRYREFTQCDADIVGSPGRIHDAECVALGYSAMTALGIENFEIRVSTRKMLTALGAAIDCVDESRLNAVFRTIDKLPSQGEACVRDLLGRDAACTAEQVETVMGFVGIAGGNAEILRMASDRLGPLAEEAARELGEVLEYSSQLGVPEYAIKVDLSIARGLDYYTGTVYETFLGGLPGFGSVMSGGRYDELIGRFLGKPVPAVGISVGIDRLFTGLLELGLVETTQTGIIAAVAAYDSASAPAALRLLARLRNAGIASELLFAETEGIALKKQMKLAASRGAPYVLVLGPDEIASGSVTLRDMRSREQRSLQVESAIEILAAFAV